MVWCPRQTPRSGTEARDGLDEIDGDAGLGRGAGARAHHDMGGPEGKGLGHGELIVAHHLEIGIDLADILHQVEGEAVVVVDDQNHCRPRGRTIREMSKVKVKMENGKSGGRAAGSPRQGASQAASPISGGVPHLHF